MFCSCSGTLLREPCQHLKRDGTPYRVFTPFWKALHKVGGAALISADHGNAEQMSDTETGQSHTAHTCNPVPLIYVGERPATLAENGALCDLAPTLLQIMDLPQPAEMTGKPLLQFEESEADD